MSNQILISSGAKLRDLDDVIIGTDGILSSLGFDVPYGVPRLDANGKILASELPNSVMEFKGVWNAATNTPTLTNGVGNAGDVYLCNVAGTVDFGAGPITFAVGDYAVYTGSVWARSSGAVGTVTSVAVSRSGDALAITGSPITTSGTINIGFTGNSSQYINGAGNLVNFPTIAPEATRLITEVYNETGATLTKGTIVYINGGHGNLPTVTKAIATGDATSAQTYGVVQSDITTNNNGYVVVIGSLNDLDTSAYTAGTQLYLSGTTAGAWTSSKPSAPIHLVYVGIVVRSHPTQGVVEIRIQNGYELDELHDVQIIDVANNDGIFYDSATSLWKNKTIAEVLGYTPANAATTLTINGTTYDLSANRTWNVGTVTSVGLSAPTGFSVTGSPVTSSGTLALSFAAGYSLPTNIKQSNWDDAYTWVAAFPTQTGNAGKFLTTDGSSLSWAANPLGTVTSVAMSVPTGLSVSGSPITTSGTLAVTFTAGYSIPTNASQTNWDTAYTNRITSLTTTGSSGAATLVSNTLNIPNYTLAGLGGVPTSRTLTINGVTYDLSADRTWTITAGISSVSGTAPISVATVSGAATVSISQATTTTNGYLSSTDWNTFNGKQNALTNPVTGTGTNNRIAKFTSTGSTIGNSILDEYIGIRAVITINNNNAVGYEVNNLNTGDSAQSFVSLNANSGTFNIGKIGTGFTPPTWLAVSDAYLFNGTSGNIVIYNGNTSGSFEVKTGGNSSSIFSVSSTGFSSFTKTLTVQGLNDGTALFANRTGGASVFALNVNLDSSWTMYDYAAGSFTAGITQKSGNIGIGMVPTYILDINKSLSGDSAIRLTNTNTGTAASSQFFASNGTTQTQFFHLGTAYTGTGVLAGAADGGGVYNNTSKGLIFISAASTGNIRFASGGLAQTMILNSSGNLGLGINTLNFEQANRRVLDINGTSDSIISISVGGNAKGYIYHAGGAMSIANYTSGERLNFNTRTVAGVDTTWASILSTGTFLVGTDSGSSGLTGATMTIRASSSNVGQTAISIQGYDKKGRWAINGQNTTDNYDFAIYSAPTGAGDWTQRFTIQQDGIVYIGGTVSGGGRLQVNGDVNINGNFKINGTIIGGGGGSGVTGSGTANYMTKWTGTSTLGNSQIYDNGTNVIIGATSGTNNSKFEIIGNGIWQGAVMSLTNTGTGGKSIALFSTNSSFGQGAGRFLIYNGTDNIDMLTLTSAGNLMLGSTTDNGYKLQVSGGGISLAYGYIFKLTGNVSDILIANTGSTMSITGSMSVSSSVTASSFFESSDSRLKKLIADNYNAVGIENVKAKLYIKDGKEELGYFAQDLENVLRSSLELNLSGYYDLSYRQVHTAKISYLENKIKELEEKLNSK